MIFDDLVWNEVQSKLFGSKRGNKGYLQINCPMCVRMGTTKDTRKRCGIRENSDSIGINCFNCGFKTKYFFGQQIGKRFQEFMEEIGIPDGKIQELKFWSWQKSLDNEPKTFIEKKTHVHTYRQIILPETFKTITQHAIENNTNNDFINAASYVLNRSHSANPDELYWSPDHKDYLIIPLLFNKKIVGYTGRATHGGVPKYNNISVPPDFLYNYDLIQNTERKYLIIVEGLFDAISISGISTMGAKLNDNQISRINSCPLEKIIVPDVDKSGKRLIDIALNNNWSISVPNIGPDKHWERDIKDCDDAVKRYGKLWTLHSILKHKTNDKNLIRIIKENI